MNRDYCIKRHREMWEYIVNHLKRTGDNLNLISIVELKSNFTLSVGDNGHIHGDCYLCEYALREMKKAYKEKRMVAVRSQCYYCLAKKPSDEELKKKRVYREYKRKTMFGEEDSCLFGLYKTFSETRELNTKIRIAEVIRDLVMKEEEEVGVSKELIL